VALPLVGLAPRIFERARWLSCLAGHTRGVVGPASAFRRIAPPGGTERGPSRVWMYTLVSRAQPGATALQPSAIQDGFPQDTDQVPQGAFQTETAGGQGQKYPTELRQLTSLLGLSRGGQGSLDRPVDGVQRRIHNLFPDQLL
jgi:hypothetical protein